jgi:hypothetical protein
LNQLVGTSATVLICLLVFKSVKVSSAAYNEPLYSVFR